MMHSSIRTDVSLGPAIIDSRKSPSKPLVLRRGGGGLLIRSLLARISAMSSGECLRPPTSYDISERDQEFKSSGTVASIAQWFTPPCETEDILSIRAKPPS